ncbi:MAG: hypothetical protein ABW224_13670 [Kibdelosporangium sp.]
MNAASTPTTEPFDSSVDPVIGGSVSVEVSGWGYWNVWVGVESYYAGDASTALQPGECVSVAWRLVTAAAVCWYKRLPDQLRGRLRSARVPGRLASSR